MPGITSSNDHSATYSPCKNFRQKPSHRRPFWENRSETAAAFPSARFKLNRAYPSRTAPPTTRVKRVQTTMQTTSTASSLPPLACENNSREPPGVMLEFWLARFALDVMFSVAFTILAPSALASNPASTAVFHLPRRASRARAR